MRTVFFMSVSLLTVTCMWLAFGFFTACKPSALPEPDVTSIDASPAPTPAPITDAAPSCINACENMHNLGCSEGADAGACAVTCAHVLSARLTTVDVACITSAKSKDAVRACKGVSPTGCL